MTILDFGKASTYAILMTMVNVCLMPSCPDVPSGKRFKESARYMLDPSVGNFGCVVPAEAWHTVEVIEPCVIFEAKDGKYGEDGSSVT